MTTDTIQEFLVKLGFEVDKNSLAQFVGGVESASMRIFAFGAAMTTAAAIVVKSVHSIAEENKALGLLAQQLGSTAGAVDDFIDTADMLGISNETATSSLKTFAGNVSDASMGIGRAKLVFEKLHIAVKDATGAMRPATEVMGDLQEKLKGMDRAKQLRIMEKLGLDPSMLVMFNDAFGNTKYIGEELGKIDVAAGFDLTKAIDESNKFEKSWKNTQVELNLFKMLFSKMYEAIAVRMMPKIREGVEAFGKTVEAARRLVMDNAKQIEAFLEPIIDVVLRIGTAFMKLIGTAFGIIGAVLKPVFDMMMDVNKATGGWAGYLAAALIAWKMFNLGFLATPLGAILGVGLAILALYDDFQTWKEGGTSLIDWTKWAPSIELLLSAIDNIVTALRYMASTIGEVLAAIGNLLSGNFDGFLNSAADATLSLFTALQSIGYAVIEIVTSIGGLIVTFGKLFGIDLSGFVGVFSKAFGFIGDLIRGIVDSINAMINVAGKVSDIFSKITGGVSSSLGELGNKLGNILSGDNTRTIAATVNASVANRNIPSSAQSSSNGGNNVNQNTVINVNGAQNPQATAQLVHAQQSTVNAQVTRNMRPAVR